ncbi:hypothetical protein [Aliarcobacter butzleri]|uniref:hypothetical protein n=1 Tax=Aliarcobacter butzleri TaxID=28197 RepID=UPI0024DE0A0F|nr:hypothetical protein [Aliarcobacter butzleri]MDK2080131.1 hypothetical protein [Aliarcobacter butzleri]
MKYFKYISLIIFFIIVAKWILTFLPSSYSTKGIVLEQTDTTIKVKYTFKNLKGTINEDFEDVQNDINDYIEKKMAELNQLAKYNLSKEDGGFLDWFFGWRTGYQMIYYKLKGYVGFDNNEIKFVEKNFTQIVLEEDKIKIILEDINNYSKLRIEDFYKSTFEKVLKDIKRKKNSIQDYKIDNINTINLPWGKYITQLGTNSFELATAIGVGSTVSAVIGAKVATIIGSKVFGIVTAKVATTIASKIATLFSIMFAPVVDYALNEGVKELQIDDTKKEFESAIDDITTSIKNLIQNEYSNYLVEISKEIDNELDKNIILEGTK